VPRAGAWAAPPPPPTPQTPKPQSPIPNKTYILIIKIIKNIKIKNNYLFLIE